LRIENTGIATLLQKLRIIRETRIQVWQAASVCGLPCFVRAACRMVCFRNRKSLFTNTRLFIKPKDIGTTEAEKGYNGGSHF